MIDLKELRELAGKALMPDPFGYGTTTADYNFRAAANPVTVLELIDERAKLIEVLEAVRMSLVQSHHSAACIFGRVVKAVEACSNIEPEGE